MVRVVLLSMAVLLLVNSAFAFVGGDGTPENPYQISSNTDIIAVNDNLSAYYILVNDIDLGAIQYDEALIAHHGEFTGNFNGNSFTIRNLTINSSYNYIGLFGQLGPAGIVKDLTLENCNISGGTYVGGISGYNFLSEGNILNCKVEGNISGLDDTGGISGYMQAGSITNCSVSGSISCPEGTAGMLAGSFGYLSGGTIKNCVASGDLAANKAGGLLGDIHWVNDISNCYSMVNVSGGQYAGGIWGDSFCVERMENCYFSGTLDGAGEKYGLIGHIRDLGGSVTGVYDCFWDTETSGQSRGYNVDGYVEHSYTFRNVVGKTTSQMKDIATFTDSGWDFVGESDNGEMEIWYMPDGDYPHLYWEADIGDVDYDGLVDEFDLYVIASQWLSSAAEQQRLVADIDESGEVENADFAMFAAYCGISARLEIELVAGSNWVSFNVLPEPAALEDVLEGYLPYASDGDKVDSAEGLSATYYQGSWYGTLETLEPGKMYKIQSQQGGNFIVEGCYADINTQIELVSGWNWLGFAPPEPMSLEQALSSLVLSDNDSISSQNGLNATYWNGSWFGNLEQLEPGAGYMLYVAQPQTFSYGEQQ